MPRHRVLIVEDDVSFANRVRTALRGLFDCTICHTEEQFRERFALNHFDVVIIDVRLRAGTEGLGLLRELMLKDPLQATIIMTAYADIETYANALELGALTYLDKREFAPNLINRIVQSIVREGELRKRVAAMERHLEVIEPSEIIGASPSVLRAREALRVAADEAERPVLILGEVGTGRNLLARNIHRLSQDRADAPFLQVSGRREYRRDVGQAIFGTMSTETTSSVHATTERTLIRAGARHAIETKGAIDHCNRGILFVEDVTALPPSTQAALFEYAATRRFIRIGGQEPVSANIQLVMSATVETDPTELAALREVFTSQCRGLVIDLPPLRERREDIPLIAQYILQNLFRQGRTRARSFQGSTIAVLEALLWPGNVRELRSAIEYGAVRADAASIREVHPEHLPLTASQAPIIANSWMKTKRHETSGVFHYQAYLARAEVALVETAVETLDTTRKGAIANALGYHDRFTFVRRVRRHLRAYPELIRDFPRTARLFTEKKRAI